MAPLRPEATPARQTDSEAATPAVNSWDEFTPLRSVVVGDATDARIPSLRDVSAWLNLYPELTSAELAGVSTGQYPRHVIEESNEDLAELAATLQRLEVTVHRPASTKLDAEFSTPHWRSGGLSAYCPRDLTLVIGSTVIETPSPTRARYHEHLGLRPLLQDCMKRGATWLSAPKPALEDKLYATDSDGRPDLTEAEPVFEAANVLRLGRDILYQVSRSGNELGLLWLQSVARLVGDVRVHPLRGIYGYTHIDSTIAILRPGLVLLNPERITSGMVPQAFKGWDILWCPPIDEYATALPHTLSGKWISMNLLMVSPTCAVVDADQPALLSALEAHGIDVIPHRLRHARVMGGGFHCVTLDLVREGGPEQYTV